MYLNTSRANLKQTAHRRRSRCFVTLFVLDERIVCLWGAAYRHHTHLTRSSERSQSTGEETKKEEEEEEEEGKKIQFLKNSG